ncbi:MAG: LytR/AlgR family response regulator transcription factor [Luteibaculaceae bacterium]
MTAVIVEDELIIADHLSMILESQGVEVLALASSLEEAAATLNDNPSFYFLDIRLAEGDSGLDFGKILKEKGIPFIYITANSENEVITRAATTEPRQYITKPFKERDILAAVQLLKIRILKAQTVELLTREGKAKINISDILFCEADGAYTTIVCEQKSHLVRMHLGQLEEILPEYFVRVHRSFLVNKNQIKVKRNGYLIFGEVSIPVSRSFKGSNEI